MQVAVISEYGVDEALIGLGLSFGKTSGMSRLDPETRSDMLHVAEKLAPKGLAHNKFLRQISVYLSVRASIYWWKQFDTYKIGTVAQSESTMHTICARDFSPSDFELDEPDALYVQRFLSVLNAIRDTYMAEEDSEKKKALWRQIIQYLPESYLQRRIVSLNYEVLRCIFRQRAGHKLGEWKQFIDRVFAKVRYPGFLADVYYG